MRPIRLWLLFILVLTACGQLPRERAPLSTVTEPLTVLIPTPKPTEITFPTVAPSPSPTNTLEPTDTPQPTETPPPTATLEPTNTPTPMARLTFELLRNSPYPTTFAGSGAVQLTDGEFQQVVSADSPIRIYSRLSDVHAFGDLDGDGDREAAVILATNTGGTGIFYELFIVEMVENMPTIVDTVLIGDRVIIHAMSIDDEGMTLDLTQRGREDSPCCPSEEARLVYVLEEKVLVQTEEITVSSAEIATAGNTVNAFMQTYLQDPTGLSSLDFVTNKLKREIQAERIGELTGITEQVASYFYGIQQRGATEVRVKVTLNQSTVQNIFFDLARVENGWLISNIDRAQPATTAFSENPCHLKTTEDSVTYQRPRVQSGVFATLPAETMVILNAQTVTGWFGFEPGMAQAANTGIFRYRWFAPNGSYTLSETCENLPLAVAVQATSCYTMPQAEVVVRAEPNPDSAVVGTLSAETSFAALIERQDGWVRVDLMNSSLFLNETGWISAETLNLNGASCDAIIAPSE